MRRAAVPLHTGKPLTPAEVDSVRVNGMLKVAR